MIRSKPANKAYLDNWDANFGDHDTSQAGPGAPHGGTADQPITTPASPAPDVRVTCRHCDCHVFVAKRAEMLTCPRCGGVSEIRS